MNTKKDYIRAANIAHAYVKPHRVSVAEAFIQLFRDDNPRFDQGSFLEACKLSESDLGDNTSR